MKSIKLKLEELTCPSCIQKIENVLNKTNGVEKANVLFNASKVKVEYDENIVSKEIIEEKIEKLGYKIIK